MRPPTALALSLSLALAGCASTVDGTLARGPDGGATDVLPGLNPDGLDPFRPVEAGVIVADAGVRDAGEFTFGDAAVFDQRYATLYVGTNSGGNEETTYVSATFRYVPYPDDPRCELRSAGSWDVSVCSSAGAAPVDPHPRTFPNAGEISLTGGLTDVALRPQPMGQYPPYFVEGTEFPGPRSVRVRAPGTREVPAFDLSFVVPPTVVVTSPTASELVIDRARDLVVEWVPNNAREVWVVLTTSESTSEGTRSYRAAVLSFGDAGRAVLPARALGALPVTARAALTVMPFNITTATIGTWPLTATVVGQGRRYVAALR
ncbi:MAG: hypothetical protein JWM10_1198 [Myxococcaceae bacterium]|nr:hypothetical protein [Myxococcaceae bacterium]